MKTAEIIKYFKDQISSIRSGRPTPKLVENLPVDYLNQKMTIKQLGSISIVPPTTIQISVWDAQAISSVSKAIESSNLSVVANIDGNLVRINLPPPSSERRQDLIKVVKKEAEEAKIKIRHIRDEENKKINRQEEEGEIGEDQKFKLKEETQKEIDKANEEIERILENKIKEIEE